MAACSAESRTARSNAPSTRRAALPRLRKFLATITLSVDATDAAVKSRRTSWRSYAPRAHPTPIVPSTPYVRFVPGSQFADPESAMLGAVRHRANEPQHHERIVLRSPPAAASNARIDRIERIVSG